MTRFNVKKNNLQQYIRKDIAGYEEYKPFVSAWDLSNRLGIPISKVDKLDAGENMFGPSPQVIKALSKYKGYQFYPDPEYKNLREAIGRYVSLDKKYIAVGNGGDEVIDLILRLVIETGDKIIDCPPTFSSYSLSTVLNRGIVVNIARKKDFSIDVEKIIDSVDKKVKVIFVCNPNNPTGNITPFSDIKKLLNTGKIIFVDETYFEFCGETTLPFIKKYDNLIILRSLSKWAGIAGLRFGFAIMSPYLVSQVMKIKMPYNVNSSAEMAGIAALEDRIYQGKVIKKIITERERMYKALKERSTLQVTPSKGNFLYIQLNLNNFSKIKKLFEMNNVAIRFFDNVYTGAAIRITVGTNKQNNQVLSILKQL